jgi:outer membrane protein OmpA-like peptidoglycan-associated protein
MNGLFRLFSTLFFIFIVIFATAQSEGKAYSVHLMDFNSRHSEFSPYLFMSDLIYVSDNSSGKKDPNTKRGFCNLQTKSSQDKVLSLISQITTKYHEGPISISADGNTVFFTRNAFYEQKKRFDDDKLMPLQLFYVIYENGQWSREYDFPLNSINYSVGHPALSPDNETLYFVSDMPGGYGGTDIYEISYKNGIWGSPKNLGDGINSDEDELFPFISDQGVLYFSSNRINGMGGLDIYYSKIENSTYSKPQILESPINSESDDFSFVVVTGSEFSPKGYFSSNRTGGAGLDDIYQWEYLKPFAIKGTVTNQKSEPVEFAVLEFTDSDGNKQVFKTGVDGKYFIPAERNNRYFTSINHPDYFDDSFIIKTTVDEFAEFLIYDVVLEDFPRFKIRPVNVDGTPIVDMKINIVCDSLDLFTGMSTPEGISWEFPRTYRRGDSVTLVIGFNKKDYLNKKVTFNLVIENGGDIVIPKEQFVFLKAEEKIEITSFIDLKPIYYDFDKWDIKPDAAKELDKVIDFLNQNPDVSIELSSHTDCRGSEANNVLLSDKRAQSAVNYIRKRVENPSQIYGKGYGENKPIHNCPNCDLCDENMHAKNRRTEFTIVKIK